MKEVLERYASQILRNEKENALQVRGTHPKTAIGSDSDYMKSFANIGFYLGNEELKECYETGKSDEDAISYIEDVAAPALRNYLDIGEEDFDPREVQDELPEELDCDGLNKKNSWIGGKTPERWIDETYEKAKERYEPGEFDQAVGIASAGTAPLYAVTSYIDADEVVLKYSKTDGDQRVKISETMEERLNPEDAEILIVDDVVEYGETLKEVGKFLQERGAKRVEAVFGERDSPIIPSHSDGMQISTDNLDDNFVALVEDSEFIA